MRREPGLARRHLVKLLVTGAAGFIGSNFVRYVLTQHPTYHLTLLDKLTYAGNLETLRDLLADSRVTFHQGDIADPQAVQPLAGDADAVINFAAETHVDRSILDAGTFIQTDVYGTWVLLEMVRTQRVARFVQVSTDEVYGEVPQGSSTESDAFRPRSPYAASKAGAELLIQAYHATYDAPVVVTRGSNTLGPYQYPEKAIPLFTTNAIDGLPLPIYGDGRQRRDWLDVEDHCAAIDLVLHHGSPGEAYNVGAGNERENLEVACRILSLLNRPERLMTFVPDRPAHDRRYSLDTARIRQLGWRPRLSFEESLERTVQWYQANEWWWRPIKSGEFQEYYRRNYGQREALLGS